MPGSERVWEQYWERPGQGRETSQDTTDTPAGPNDTGQGLERGIHAFSQEPCLLLEHIKALAQSPAATNTTRHTVLPTEDTAVR